MVENIRKYNKCIILHEYQCSKVPYEFQMAKLASINICILNFETTKILNYKVK